MLGVPIREGTLWHLSTEENLFVVVQFSLYVNGFSFSHGDGPEASVALSPFSLVRYCRFKSADGGIMRFKSFKVMHSDSEPCTYFAVQSNSEHRGDKERANWVMWITYTIQLMCSSVLPRLSVSCDPLHGAPQTGRRLLAGYLLHRSGPDIVSAPFCELSVHRGATSRMVLYEDDSCEAEVQDIFIAESTVCFDVVGTNSTCFVVGRERFAAQSSSERKLWLRAFSNVKVKLQCQAPEPSEEQLSHYRDEIREHIDHAEATMDRTVVSDALLPVVRIDSKEILRPTVPKEVLDESGRLDLATRPPPAHSTARCTRASIASLKL